MQFIENPNSYFYHLGLIEMPLFLVCAFMGTSYLKMTSGDS